MKRIIFFLIKLSIFLFVIMAIYNYLDMNFFRKSIKERYIDESYLRPNFVNEFEKIKKQQKSQVVTADSMEEPLDEKLDLEEVIVNHSDWQFHERDLSGLREEWNYKVFDYVKKHYADKAEEKIRAYLKIKNDEIKLIRKLEENFQKISAEYLEKNNNKKDTQYYKKFRSQYQAKEELEQKTRDVLRNRKIELFGAERFKELEEMSDEYILTIQYRLKTEYSFTEQELETLETNFISGKLLLVP